MLTFGGIGSQNLKKAKIVILPVPYETTTSWIKGTKKGPKAILKASQEIEEIWGENFHSEIEEKRLIFTFEEKKLPKIPKKAIFKLFIFLKKIYQKEKIPFLIGGEHTISLAGVMAAKEKWKNFTLLHLDAHTDFRDEYLKEKFSHACLIRRIYDLKIPVVSVGVRSVDCDVLNFLKKNKIKNIFFAPSLPTKKILSLLSENIYLTFDFDFLDPSIMPSVGNPQPGGFLWPETIDFLEKICEKKNIIGADFVELCPIPNFFAPNFLAAKLIYKVITFVL